MVQASDLQLTMAALLPVASWLPPLALPLLGGIAAFVLTYLLTFAVRSLCLHMGWLDYPSERRVHMVPVPRLGGVAIFLSFAIASLLFYTPAHNIPTSLYVESTVYWLFLLASLLLVVVHLIDDLIGLKPLIKLVAQTVAAAILLAPWEGRFHGIFLFSFNNPFAPGLVYLGVHDNAITLAAIPALCFTWFWMVGMMNTVNLIDGVDGLAAGVVGITALFTALISWVFHQESIAVLAAIFTGAVLGFLPHNWNPARIFMGDTGAMFLGLGLAVMSTIGGAKLALALMLLGVPILDVAVVAINRIRHGQRPWHYDKTHLHHRLMAAGLTVKQICYLFYGVTLAFGVLAAGLSILSLDIANRQNAHLFKFISILLVVVIMVALIVWIDYRQRQRGGRLQLGDPSPSPAGNSDGAVVSATIQEQETLLSTEDLAPTPAPAPQTNQTSGNGWPEPTSDSEGATRLEPGEWRLQTGIDQLY
ncbi:undecaprenyl-phosphate alpha-N-acetylglucosaminyl 1-phosphate transferase [Thermogemmatispora carboxidivorans]|uniref:undecaprenyl-phosphate alpha-N-acetylglucosaminyl 1-phosphate transferase n=1 Tax=Thermogemmatispora carboxidivorans TaxID=1382306 RepID=UPI00069B3F3E|nr:undecaprenyl-phosphate alpha-N-acetylglucosaminyl 1-phosphate transferase [Thermogemmatispora carboxidivorans]